MSTFTQADTSSIQPAAPPDIGALRRLGAWFVAASVLWWIAAAALIPDDDFFLGETARDEALSIAQHDGLFRAFHVFAAFGTAAGAVGVVLLARWLRARRRSRLADVATVVAAVGLIAWLVEVAIRMTATVSRARDDANGTGPPGDEPAIGSWAVFAVAALGFLAPMLCSWVLAQRSVPGRRSSVIVAGLVTLATIAGAATLAPSVIYQFGLLPLGITLVLVGRRTTSVNTAVSAVGPVRDGWRR
jgi:cytochrome bd-type quinol oxidase subunit 2